MLARRRATDRARPIRHVVAEARRVAVVVAMHRYGGNLSNAAKALGTSRRALRETLKGAGLYPWAGAPATDGQHHDDDGHVRAARMHGPTAKGGA